jgi:hypothetical protein
MREAISVPCFEFWVLLHHERTDVPCNRCDNVIEKLRIHIPGYQKADAATAKQLMARVSDALVNADWVEGRAADNNYNPYTSVYKVLRHFEAVAGQEENP